LPRFARTPDSARNRRCAQFPPSRRFTVGGQAARTFLSGRGQVEFLNSTGLVMLRLPHRAIGDPAAGYPGGMTEPRSAPAAVRVRAVLIAVLILAVDQLTKLWAVSVLPGHAPIRVLGDFLRLRLLYNPGAAFSIGTGSTWIFTILTAAAVVGIGWLVTKVRSTGWAVALGMLLGGATTHLLDRLFRDPGFARGHVVDFIDYNGWFVGNVADIALTLGAVVIVILSMLGIGMDGKKQAKASS
jgi:signal peptidase II